MALIHSEGVLAGEMKHGTLALVDETLPILVVATRDCTYRKMVSVVEQLRARNAWLIVLVNENDELLTSPCCKGCTFIEVWPCASGWPPPEANAELTAVRLQVPEVDECLQAVVNIVPLQLLSYHLTVRRGFNVDQPRNLAKSVTVSEE